MHLIDPKWLAAIAFGRESASQYTYEVLRTGAFRSKKKLPITLISLLVLNGKTLKSRPTTKAWEIDEGMVFGKLRLFGSRGV